METKEKHNETTDSAGQLEIIRLKEELRREHQMYLRSLADFDNYRRRVERERTIAARNGKREVMISLLEVLDAFDRALQQMLDEPASIREGFQAIHRKLLGVLEAQGVAPINAVGEQFNPEVHEAAGSVETEKYDSGTIIDEVQRGYRWEDEVLRPSVVRVAV